MIRALLRLFAVLCILACGVWLYQGGRLLVVDRPEHADAIVSLEGEDHVRVERALELLRAGYAPRVFLNVSSTYRIYGQAKTAIAQHFVDSLPPGERERVSICPVAALSTFQEARADAACLARVNARNVIVVTSDYHTRRALAIYRDALPDHHVSVAAAYDPQQFGAKWWQRRQWAKVFLDESLRIGWYYVVDRWR